MAQTQPSDKFKESKKHAFELLLYKWPVRHFVKITGFQMIFKSHLERKNSFKE